MVNIDYKLLASAIEHYRQFGFIQTELPWFIPKFMMFKQPIFNSFVLTEGKHRADNASLIGSAEQSFVYLASTNQLISDRLYMAITPCFRDDELDELHYPQFMKLELFKFGQVTYEQAKDDSKSLLSFARDLFRKFTNLDKNINIANTTQGYDLMLDDIEIGSYYANKFVILDEFPRTAFYSCGTGLALPRFNIARGY